MILSLLVFCLLYYSSYQGRAIAISSFSEPTTFGSNDFVAKLHDDLPVLGKVVAGKPLVITTTLTNLGSGVQAAATHVIQILGIDGSAIRLEIKEISISTIQPTEISYEWVPIEPGTYVVEGFLLSEADIGKQKFYPATDKETISIHVVSETNSNYNRNITRTYTFCETGCDYSDLQSALDSSQEPQDRILIKDGTYLLGSPIDIRSHTTLEFSKGARITYFGPSGSSVFQGHSVENVAIANSRIAAIYGGISAFNFTSSNRINVTGGEISLVKGENSTAFYCRDCRDILLSRVTFSNASRLVDIKTSSDTLDGNSSNIWIQDGSFASSSIEAIKVNYSYNVYVTGNQISNSNNNSIDIGYDVHSVVRNNTIQDGGIPNGSAIHTDSAQDVFISENIIYGSGSAGVTVYRASYVNILNNTIVCPSENGIAIISTAEPSANIRVTHNRIQNAVEHAVFVSAGQQFIGIHDNNIEHVRKCLKPAEM